MMVPTLPATKMFSKLEPDRRQATLVAKLADVADSLQMSPVKQVPMNRFLLSKDNVHPKRAAGFRTDSQVSEETAMEVLDSLSVVLLALPGMATSSQERGYLSGRPF